MILAVAGLSGALAWVAIPGGEGSRYAGRPLGYWLARLAHPDYRVRSSAEAALEPLGAEAARGLVAALDCRDTLWRRWWDGVAVRWWGPNAFPGVSAARIREQAARLLTRIGPPNEATLACLVRHLDEPDEDAARAIQSAILGAGPAALPHLERAVAGGADRARGRATQLLGYAAEFGPPDSGRERALCGALHDTAIAVRVAAVDALASLRCRGPATLDGLGAVLADADPGVRQGAVGALGILGRRGEACGELLRARLDDEDPRVAVEAARSLWRIEARSDVVLPRLVAALSEPQAHWQAALVLCEMGTAASAAIPALLDRLEHEVTHRPSRTPPSSALALGRLGPDAVPGLIRLLEHTNTGVRISAAMALASHGPLAHLAVPSLQELLADPDSEMQIVALNALGAIGHPARPALPELEAIADRATDYLRAAAVAAVGRIRGAGGSGAALPAASGDPGPAAGPWGGP